MEEEGLCQGVNQRQTAIESARLDEIAARIRAAQSNAGGHISASNPHTQARLIAEARERARIIVLARTNQETVAARRRIDQLDRLTDNLAAALTNQLRSPEPIGKTQVVGFFEPSAVQLVRGGWEGAGDAFDVTHVSYRFNDEALASFDRGGRILGVETVAFRYVEGDQPIFSVEVGILRTDQEYVNWRHQLADEGKATLPEDFPPKTPDAQVHGD